MTPAGWYPDPSSAPQQRYWDGSLWTDQVQPFPDPAPAVPTKQKKRGTGLIVAGLAIAAFGTLLSMIAASTTHATGYGSTSGGPTLGGILFILAGLVLAGIGFCIRLLGAVERR